ncbi:FERM/acyl-CoA-binding protein [Dioscorea alata]|uniref:FERM/acyl-CoA-binding protein n=1 Tax=Dioscorea alata TaxID=55571 RepID=A0ACB7U0N4_DIOAL|nr:FERM/acyl-CoA-binding protein [Dioscorea alata]
MDFVYDLFLTAFLSVLLAFLVGKIFSIDTDEHDENHGAGEDQQQQQKEGEDKGDGGFEGSVVAEEKWEGLRESFGGEARVDWEACDLDRIGDDGGGFGVGKDEGEGRRSREGDFLKEMSEGVDPEVVIGGINVVREEGESSEEVGGGFVRGDERRAMVHEFCSAEEVGVGEIQVEVERFGVDEEVYGRQEMELARTNDDSTVELELKKREIEKRSQVRIEEREEKVEESEQNCAASGREDMRLGMDEVGVDEEMELKKETQGRLDRDLAMAMAEKMEFDKVNEEERLAEGEVGIERRVQPFEGDIEQEKGHDWQIGKEVRIGIKEVGSLLDGEDEWEGIERTELQERFGDANAYVGSRNGVDAISKLNSDVQMQLYGLHKVATEGPCFEPQPSALKIAARSKWHAWQRLGDMNPEMAMEKYMDLLSEQIPGWTRETTIVESKQDGSKNVELAEKSVVEPPDQSSPLAEMSYQLPEIKSKQEENTCTEGNVAVGAKVTEPGPCKVDDSPHAPKPE